ncbi:peptidylprolyl isomerase [Gemmatimonas phototrophica]|uniref:peptidylprolyl isomerase n=1 Tax=Gemmatimonas phototrophica TaxID=1379270 RepID=UPI0006A70C1D|nr:peptidylprolyl isomerase [Gemmatimonas phototrophica]
MLTESTHGARRALVTVGLIMAVLGGAAACGAPAEQRRPVDSTAKVQAAPVIPPPQSPAVASPARFTVRVETSKGPFVVEVTRDLAPHSADRFYELVTNGYFADVRFFRLVPGFVVQFGVHGDPAVNAVWDTATIADDVMRTSNRKGTLAFAANGPHSRSTQLFISTGENGRKLDGQRLFTPFGRVVQGMDVVEKLNAEYGEEPNAIRAVRQGNRYLTRWFPALDYIVRATVLSDSSASTISPVS